MVIDIENLPAPLQFAYIAMTKSAIYFKEMGQKKEFFLAFCDEIWNSMEMTDLEYLKDVLEGKMKKDIEPHVESYIRSRSSEKKFGEIK